MKHIGLVLFFFIMSGALQAEEAPQVYLNGEFVRAEHCTEHLLTEPLFYGSDTSDPSHPWHENIRGRASSNSRKLGEVPIGSFLQVSSRTRDAVGTNQYAYVRVLRNSDYRRRLRAPVSNDFRGFLFGTSLVPPELWKYEVTRSNNSLPLNGRFVQVARTNGQYASMYCCQGDSCREYPIFNVFSDDQLEEKVLRFAARPESMDFIRSWVATRVRVDGAEEDGDELEETATSSPQVLAGSSSSAVETSLRPTLRPANLRVNAPVEESNFQYLICPRSGRVNLRGENLSNVVSQANRFQDVRLLQNWGEGVRRRTIRGREYEFVQVQYEDRQGRTQRGWVARNFVRPSNECEGFEQYQAGQGDQQGSTLVTFSTRNADHPLVAAIADIFPLLAAPLRSFVSGFRRFGAGRSGGRKHAGSDLYGHPGDPIRAVADGEVINFYEFYAGTYALEVRHRDGRVIRYGEVSGRLPRGVRVGSYVRRGDEIGYIGDLIGITNSMLHFEAYEGTGNGALTNRGNRPYQRRNDLVDPSDYLTRLQRQGI